jgi:hypothetical protein
VTLANLGSSSRRSVRLVVFILLEKTSTSRRIFISSHSLLPLWSLDQSFRPHHDQNEHEQHITQKLHARPQDLITSSSQTPTSYLMSCQSDRTMSLLCNGLAPKIRNLKHIGHGRIFFNHRHFKKPISCSSLST